ncbi:hypothetical protein DL766_002457 [Monosporascus sp. MC13-8B]|uniref:Thioesterase domain-containing protein n=1 Tax=Monosporascus cannonballus TaxID=155416 RepID=A0ABY0HFD4_9PEZI|nr:hypothetical protein DL762_002870 [Monosporascus cannonballus]RYO95607.1 hypothetical protein DL763_003677 [Monosporascus cannonballus]RYP35446.1 hypothetical protein DL766_002457 [Monosporascus sp. MC13-8B]
MPRPRIQTLYSLPVPRLAHPRLCTPTIRRAPSPGTITISRLLTTSPRRFNEPPKAAEPKKPGPIPTSTAATPLEQAAASDAQAAANPQQQRPDPPRRRRGVLYAAFFLLVGTTLGSLFRITIAPPDLPEPGTPEDEHLLAVIRRKAAALPLVQRLETDPEWTSWDAYSGMEDPEASDASDAPDAGAAAPRPQGRRGARLTSGALAGSRGLAYQRVFRNDATGEFLSVVYFGGGTAGWPGVVHGGCLATVLDESLGRCAVRRFPSRTGVTASLELTYKAPTRTEAFYVVRAQPASGEAAPGKSDRKAWVEGSVETLDGQTCVLAKGLFVVPKSIKLASLDGL